MLSKRKQSNTDGFTIIEVLIVLAIAGLILLIVFLAVPALQRNSRNTQRKNDVSALLSGVGEYTSNSGGALPDTAKLLSTVPESKRSYYKTDANIVVSASIPASAPDIDHVTIVTGAKCGADATAAPVDGAARSVVAYYSVEGASSNISQCLESGA